MAASIILKGVLNISVGLSLIFLEFTDRTTYKCSSFSLVTFTLSIYSTISQCFHNSWSPDMMQTCGLRSFTISLE